MAALSLVATLSVYGVVRHYVRADVQQRFDRNVQQLQDLMQAQVQDHYRVLYHARALFNVSHRVEAAEFEAFMRDARFTEGASALYALEFIERVDAGDVEAFKRSAAADGVTLDVFRHDDAPAGDDLRVIKYVEPKGANELVIGFDAGSNPAARRAMDHAAATGEPILSAPLVLFQEPGDSLAVVMYLAVYQRHAPLHTPEHRLAAAKGWIAAVLRVQDLAAVMQARSAPGLDIALFDVTDPADTIPLGDHGPDAHHHHPGEIELESEHVVAMAGRRWLVHVHSHNFFTTRSDRLVPIAVIPVGLLLGGALVVITWSILTTRARALAMAERMTWSLRAAEAEARKLALVAERTSNAVFVTDKLMRIEWVNEGFTRITGYTAEEVRGRTPEELFYGPEADPATAAYIVSSIQAGRGFQTRLLHYGKGGRTYWASVEGQPLTDENGALRGFMALQCDISAQKRAEDELRTAAETDRLTGLLNREQFLKRVEQAIATRHHSFAVLFLDFDRFKLINDSLGHHAGDRLLIEVAGRLRRAVDALRSKHRGWIEATVARAGGDEFTILLVGDVSPALATGFAGTLSEVLGTPYQLDEHEVHFAASIGITTSEMRYAHAGDILRDADTAMYAAKAAGKAGYVLFDVKMHEAALSKLRLESELRRALARNELRLVYQPIVSLETGELQGFEALMRWRHPEFGEISPVQFIPIAEESGLIVPIGEWAMHESCRQLAAWRRELPEAQRLRINVNLSRRQLLQSTLVESVERALHDSGLPADKLYVEITESMLMEMADAPCQTLARLRALGLKLVMDDFGTGYSSLSYLHQFPISGLKIDRSFVKHMAEQRDLGAIVQAIIALAHSMGIRVTAEGIETTDQLIQLQALECDDAQGYHFARPLAAGDAHAFITDHAARARAA